jgi:uncharacterized protein (DUF488 family)
LRHVLRNRVVERVDGRRRVPLSRKPGFSKSALAARLEANGISYIHLKGLGAAGGKYVWCFHI